MHLEIALIRVAPDTSQSVLIGVTRDPRIAAAVHRVLRDELEVAVCKIDGAGADLADVAEDETHAAGAGG